MKNRPGFILFPLFLFAFTLVAIRAFDTAAAGTAPLRTKSESISAPPSTTHILYLPLILKNNPITTSLWRFGANYVRGSIFGDNSMNVEAMRFGWYTDFQANPNAPELYGMEYVPTVRLKQWKVNPGTLQPTSASCKNCAYVQPYTYTLTSSSMSAIQVMASNRRGKTWLIGNEMERRDWDPGSQDEMLPELYAQAYHDLYYTIKAADSTAQIAIGGMIEATPLRLEYLDRVWNGYYQTYSQTMPVDIWNIHIFVLPEKLNDYGADIPAGLTETEGATFSILDHKNFSIGAGQISALRTWMQQHGQQNKPLFVSEYGVLFPVWYDSPNFTSDQVRDSFMYPSFDYFLNQTDVNLGYPADGYRLVQRWNWYSIDDDTGYPQNSSWFQYFNGNLYYSGLDVAQGGNAKGQAPLGNYWKQYVQPLPVGYLKPY